MAPENQSSPSSPTRAVLIDYLRRLSEIPPPTHTPIFLPCEAILCLHARIMIAPFFVTNTTSSECYKCTLHTRKVGRSWLIEAKAQQLPGWALFEDDHPNGDTLRPAVVRRIVLEKRDDREGPDPGWADLCRVLFRETLMEEGAYFVDGPTGAVEGVDT